MADRWELRKLQDVSKDSYFGSKLIDRFDSQQQAESEARAAGGIITYVNPDTKTVYFRDK